MALGMPAEGNLGASTRDFVRLHNCDPSCRNLGCVNRTFLELKI